MARRKKKKQCSACEVIDLRNEVMSAYGEDTSIAMADNDKFGDALERTLNIGKKTYTYISYGDNDQLPYEYLDNMSKNIVLSASQSFNVKATYGQGLRFVNRETRADAQDEEIRHFCLYNSLPYMFLSQVSDVKNLDFYVAVIVLSGDGSKIVSLRHRDACNCRFEKADSRGKINHIFYGDFRTGHAPGRDEDRIEVLELLDVYNPLGDLMVRMGRLPNEMGVFQRPTQVKKFAILCKMPSPGFFYYPRPTWTSVYRDDWFDTYKLIALGKKQMIKNTSAPRMQIEMHRDYLDNVCDSEGIVDPEARKKRKDEELRKIKEFVTGVENAGKAMVSMYYMDPNGKENRMVRFQPIGTDGDHGGAWANDGAEASNFLCYGTGVHPNLVGAVPGKSQMNNSGSDKRELFTMVQALEKSYQDIMSIPYHLILHYNGWDKENTIDIPMIILTTLDQNTDAKRISNSNTNTDDNTNEND